MKYAWIDAHRDSYEVLMMCRLLGVSRSGWYAARGRQPSARAQGDQRLLEQIRQCQTQHRGRYGRRRMHRQLCAGRVEPLNEKRVGRLMRATAMDELPQLWNIFRGDMSFVGPRALRPGEAETDGSAVVPIEAIPGYDARTAVRPGLTGIAQIYAPRDVPRRQKFRYDRIYVRRASMWLDLRLILLSFWISFRGTWESRGRKY